MASRKDQKEQARAARLAKEQAATAKTQRTRRLQIFGGVIAIAVVVIVVAIVVSSGGGTPKTGLQTGTQESATYKTVPNELKGIPESGTTLGSPSAKVTLTYFGDLQCPICAEFTTTSNYLPEFIAKDVKTGIAKVTYKSLCTATCDDYSESLFNQQQEAAYAAGKQDKFWYYAELFYRQQGQEGSGYVTSAFLDGLARQIPGLNVASWKTALNATPIKSAVVNDQVEAQNKYGFSATPSFVITGPKGPQSLGSAPIPYSELAQAVKAVS
jgi:protein-disulfide isomerase